MGRPSEVGVLDPQRRHTGLHWLRPSMTSWTPPVCIYVDTETVPETVNGCEVHRLRLWSASLVVRRHSTPGRVGRTTAHGTTADELAAWVTDAVRGHGSVWLWAHNLGFDLAVTHLPSHLAALGWQVSSVVMVGKAAVVRMRRGRVALCMVDSWSWLQVPLAVLGTAVGTEKPSLPRFDDGDDPWLARCAADVAILEAAVCQLLDWWDEAGEGRWSVTGAGCAMTTVRRRLRQYTVMADPDPEARAFERRAIYGGRRDLTRFGRLDGGPWVELDFVSAYPTVAGALDVPCVPKGWDDGVAVSALADPPRATGWIAEVVVQSASPAWPARTGGDVVCPVGTWRTVLAGPELQAAAREGAILEVGRARRYWCHPALADWSRWVLATLRGEVAGTPEVVRIAAKGWSRSGLGKFAGRTSESQDRGPAWAPGWRVMEGWDGYAGQRALMIELAGRRWWVTRNLEALDAVPAIYAWIESACRLRLRAVLDALGEDVWVQADTDGVICDVQAMRRWLRSRGKVQDRRASPHGVAQAVCDELAAVCAPLQLRPKGMLDSLELAGPQHLEHSSGRKLAGVRHDAERTGSRTWTARTWPGLAWQLRRSTRAGFARPQVTTTLPAVTAHRWALLTGALRPLEAALAPDGDWTVVRWPETAWAASGAVLAPDQWRGVTGLIT